MRAETGSGSVLAIGLLGATVATAATIVAIFAVFAVNQQVQGAADAAALAAADTASGLLPGIPCELAATVATANGAVVTVCSLDGLIARVEVTRRFRGIDLSALARAGPPPDED